MSETWFNNNRSKLGHFETLTVSNTVIVSAVGNKSTQIKKQILCEVRIDNCTIDCVFLIIPGLIRDCLLGMKFLKQTNGIINIPL